MARDEPPSVQTAGPERRVRSTQQLLEETLERTVHLKLKLTGDLPHVKADENELAQMLINLAVNARDAMHGDGSITFRTQVEDHGVLLTVSDTGQESLQTLSTRSSTRSSPRRIGGWHGPGSQHGLCHRPTPRRND